MATIVTKKSEIDAVTEGGKRLALILKKVAGAVVLGITTKSLDELAERLIRDGGDEPAFLGYTPDGSGSPYPATLCISINDEVVHGIPKERILKEGDIVGLDLGLKHGGFFVDSAVTVGVGKIDKAHQKLIRVTKESLLAGISAIKAGGRIGDISSEIERVANREKYGIVRILGGHGVGRAVHESPYVPNYGKKGTGPELKEGMLLAIEPMLNEGGDGVYLDRKDGYTFRTLDGSRSAHFEHTVMVTDKGSSILTE